MGTVVDHSSLSALLERSRAVRAESLRVAARASDVRALVDRERRRSLAEATAASDNGAARNEAMDSRLARLSGRIGRSPEIEQAKGVLAGKFGITRGEAFAILQSVSSHTNRKLRDVAVEFLDREPDGNRGTLNHSG